MSGPPTQSAADSCTHLIEFGEHTPDALSALYDQRAEIYLRLNLAEAAFADFTEAIRVAPRRVWSYFERGNAYFGRRDYARALVDFDRAGELDPHNAHILNMRCFVRAAMGQDLEAARRLCNRALYSRPNHPPYLDSRGLVELKAQRFDRAWADYDAAFHWRPESAHSLYGRGIAAIRLGRLEAGQADIARALSMEANIGDTYAGYGITP